ncbi:MAG: tetratricopeptide repeat protein [Chryseobacterium jejuense]|uniref:tetratricopeptide repeat protein n=1 Tax=Chryseobacterium jejuense TaxID=445960 RepID=UPI003D11F374
MLLKKIQLLFLTVFVFVSFLGQKYSPKQIDSLGKIAAFNMADKRKALKLLFTYLDLVDKPGSEKEKVTMMYRITVVYSELGENEKLIEYSFKLEDYAKKINDPSFEILAVRMRATSYKKLGILYKAESMLNVALERTSELKGDELFSTRGALFSDLGLLKDKMDSPNYNVILAYHRKALGWFRKIKNKENREVSLTTAYSNMGLYSSKVNQYDSALYYSHKALELSILRKDTARQGFAFGNIGYVYYNINNQDSAIFYLHKALPIMESIERPYQLKDVYNVLALVYEKEKDYKNSLYYRNKYKKLDDSLYDSEKRAVNKESIQANERNKQQVNWFYFILGGVLVVLLIIIYFATRYFRGYQKERKEKQQKDVVISDLEDKVNDAFEEVIQLAKSDDPAFLPRFKEVYPDFYKKLSETYPFLTSGQLKFCALLRLNFSTKEIAHYNHLTIRGIEIKKNRLRKQLDISSFEDLNNWMMKF